MKSADEKSTLGDVFCESAPSYSKQEEDFVVNSLMRLKKEKIQVFLESHGCDGTGTKVAKREELMEALSEGTITYNGIIKYLDLIEPWGKQHVLLYEGKIENLNSWRDPKLVLPKFEKHGLGKTIKSHISLALPDKLTVSSIELSNKKLRITAIERREGALREPELDKRDEVQDLEVVYKAYVYTVVRGFSIFEWDLVTNQAFLQITQLPTGHRYDDAAMRFFDLLDGIIDMGGFTLLDLRGVITKLHELEESGKPETRSHGIGYRTLQGRTLTGKSSSGSNALFGETVIDDAMARIRKVGVGHLGNFYWLPKDENSISLNPLEEEVHVELIGEFSRVNFMSGCTEEGIRYVLQRIRILSK